MKFPGIKYVALCILVTGSACEKFGEAPAEESDLQFLYQEWNHSYEEEDDGARTDFLRPALAESFPPSWYRKRYVFSSNGNVSWLELSAVDTHYMRYGTWQYDPDDPATINIYDKDGALVELASFRILILKPNFMEIEPYSPAF